MISVKEMQKRKVELKARRKPLFDSFEKNPEDTNLLREIRIVDDLIAECNQEIARERANRN